MNNDPSVYKRRLPWTWLVFLISALILVGFLIGTYRVTENYDSEATIYLLNFLASLPGRIILLLVGLIVTASNIYLHYLYAKSKGYPASLTLLFVINTIGLAILILLPDRTKKAS